MTLPIWPTELPTPLLEGYSQATGDGRLRTQADQGLPRVRRRYSAAADVVDMTLQIERDLLGRFDRFFDEEIKKGVLPFLMPDPTTDGWGLLAADGTSLLGTTGDQLLVAKTWLCLWGDQMPTRKQVDIFFKISFNISVMP